MNNKIFTFVLVASVAVLLGVGIVAKQSRDPLLREMINQQAIIVETQNRMERKISGPSTAKRDVSDLVDILIRLQDIEKRLVKVEAGGGIQQAKGSGGVQAAPVQEDYAKVHNIPVAHSPVIGNKNALVTIVEFVDFQCPFCARFHKPVTEILKAYPNDVNYILKNFPLSFHPQARPAAKAAFAAAEQGKYKEMVDALLASGNSLSEDTFKNIAKDIGLNVNKFLKDYKDKDAQWERYIQTDISLAGQVGVRGTPTIYINGRKTTARDFLSFKNEIDAILNE